MRLGRLTIAGVVTMLLGCATAESIEDEGAGGTVGGATGSGGKADSPGGGGAGNASSGGTAGAPGSGGTSSGGTSSGGTSSGGAASGGAASGGASSGGSGGTCASGQKKCTGVCIAPSPAVGCSLSDCVTCPNPPANSTSICNGSLCDFKCNAGYTQSGNSCVGSGGGGAPAGGGGATGTGGATGCAAPCNPSDITSQFLCTFYCATITGKPGLCAPVLNCCTCPS